MRVLSERTELRLLHPGWFCGTKDLSQGLNPLFTTLVENCLVTPFLATLPKSLDLKSFICHTCDTPPGAAGVLLTRHATKHVYSERPSKVKDLSCSPMKDFYPERSPLLPRTPFNESTPAGGWHDVSCPYRARAKNRSEDRPLYGPEDGELFFDAGEVFVTGGKGGFAGDGEGGSEAVDVGEIEIGFEFGSEARELNISRDQMDRQLRDLHENLPGETRALVTPDGIVDLAPIDDAHEEFTLAVDGELDELLDLFGAGTVR